VHSNKLQPIVIASFKSRALKRFWERGDEHHLPPRFVAKIALVLDALDAATTPGDLDLPGFGFHPLKGSRRGQYSVVVTHNWRITFRWHEGDAIEVDFVDYHGD
jgi:proteic killer suppression protein